MAAINVSNTSKSTSGGAKQTLSLQSRILDYFNGDENCDIPSKTTQNWYTNKMFSFFSSFFKSSFLFKLMNTYIVDAAPSYEQI